MRSLVVFRVIDIDVMTMLFCPSNTCMELPLDHVLHHVISGVGTPEAIHVSEMESNCTTDWLIGGTMMSGSTKKISQYIKNITQQLNELTLNNQLK